VTGVVQAWGHELRRVHRELRAQLSRARADLTAGRAPGAAAASLTLHCAGFCDALTRHHGAEDRALFPPVLAAHPELAGDVARLIEDHRLLAGLISDLGQVAGDGDPAAIARHLDGIEAIMESHFAFEERKLAGVLSAMTLDAEDPAEVLGLGGPAS
jgi:Hemerythrin HHE cation binding domain